MAMTSGFAVTWGLSACSNPPEVSSDTLPRSDGGGAGDVDADGSDSAAPLDASAGEAPDASGPDGGSAPPFAWPYNDRRCPVTVAPPVSEPTRTLYIDASDGDDEQDGRSEATAWRTLGRADDLAQPGDLILLRGRFGGQSIDPQNSGRADAKIVYRAAPSGAVLDGMGDGTAIRLGGVHHIVIDGLEITGYTTTFYVSGNSQNVWVRNINVHDSGVSKLPGATDMRIEDSQFLRCTLEESSAGTCFYLYEGSIDTVFARNRIGDVNGTTMMLSGSAGTILTQNDLSNPLGGIINLFPDATETLIECNRIADAAAMRDGHAVAVFVRGSGTVIRYNLILNNDGEALAMRSAGSNVVRDNEIYHNTVVGNGGPAIRMVVGNASSIKDNRIEDNIFWDNNKWEDSHWMRDGIHYPVVIDLYHADEPWPAGMLGGNSIRRNIIGINDDHTGLGWFKYNSDNIGVRGVFLLTLEEAEAQYSSTFESNSDENPQFVDPEAGDYRLRATSPAIDRGNSAGATPGIGPPDSGRFEYDL